ncbi:MAG: DUF3540 domain-containing protein [Desulfovibrio sp.]|jgi:hypothetical protein|nr:DUF3540 domain-containing protein [Desulfovibrio sp.]
MAQTAEHYTELSAQLITGLVMGENTSEDGSDATFRVRCGNKTFEARLAASCLMRPERDDTTLLAHLEDGANVILSVLYRADAASVCRLRLPEDSKLECPGRLTVTAADDLSLQSGKSMGLQADALSLSASSADLRITRATAMLNQLDACCNFVYMLGNSARQVFQTLTQCLGSSRRMIEGEDETRAGSSTLMVTENATVMAKNGLTLVEDTARTDAKLIQLG